MNIYINNNNIKSIHCLISDDEDKFLEIIEWREIWR